MANRNMLPKHETTLSYADADGNQWDVILSATTDHIAMSSYPTWANEQLVTISVHVSGIVITVDCEPITCQGDANNASTRVRHRMERRHTLPVSDAAQRSVYAVMMRLAGMPLDRVVG